jgi:hypothetical protein
MNPPPSLTVGLRLQAWYVSCFSSNAKMRWRKISAAGAVGEDIRARLLTNGPRAKLLAPVITGWR